MDQSLVGEVFLESVAFRFKALKRLADGAIEQLDPADLHWTPAEGSNSIAVIIQHLHGNMISRWTDFLTADGNKPTRDRDAEFTPDRSLKKEELMRRWEEGWRCLFDAIDALEPEDVTREVKIRGQGLSVIDAIERQVMHYAYHVGQIVFSARQRKGEGWKYLSIPPGKSEGYVPKRRD